VTIFQGSRYEFEAVERVPHFKKTGNIGYFYSVFSTPVGEIIFQFSSHIVEDGDRLEALAGLYYDNSELWHVIAYANPEILYPDNLTPGSLIRIPDDPYAF
jgi:nucleoid-associated protein YgaU